MKKFLVLMTLSVFFAVSTTVMAGLTAGLITFHVKDSHGHAIEGVHIVVVSERAENFKIEITTDKHGKAKSVLKFDHYKAIFSKDGYQGYSYKFKPKLSDRKVIEIKLTSLEEAMKKAESTLTGKDKAVVLFNEAVPLMKAGKDKEALPKLREAIQLDPELAPALFHIGRIDMKNNNLDDAEKSLLKALQVDPDMSRAYSMLSELYKRKGDTENYQKYLNEAESRGVVSAGEYYNQAAAAINEGDDAKAKSLLDKAIKANPKFADSYYQLGMCAMRSGEYAKSIENLQKYLEIEPTGKHAAECKQFITALKSML
ncbi:MAG: tetratricopeptide repeat protein [Acidobacteria bacterium]|nr:tetratricopeptide repeat protein [Acidobacteriota bacterium]